MDGPWFNSVLNKTTVKEILRKIGKYDYQLGIRILNFGSSDTPYSDYAGKCFVFLKECKLKY